MRKDVLRVALVAITTFVIVAGMAAIYGFPALREGLYAALAAAAGFLIAQFKRRKSLAAASPESDNVDLSG